ncbi:MAG: type II toxin-antitoxin system PemK/MazF family toxin [Methylococcaceae bacterium]
MVKRGEVYWVNLDPTVGTEIKKTRPCLIVSPDDLNAILPRVMIAPLTSKGQKLGCRPEVSFNGKNTRILLDQLRTIDKQRLLGKIGEIEKALWHPILLEMLE